MMLGLFVILALSSGAMAQNCCSAENGREVQRMWQEVWSAEFTGRRIAVARSVFADLFAAHPGVIPLFARVQGDNVDSPEFRSHCVRVVNALDTSIHMLSSSAVLNKQLEHLSEQHIAREGVKAAHFGALAHSFSRVMPQVTNCFNPSSWENCFNRITNGIAAGLP